MRRATKALLILPFRSLSRQRQNVTRALFSSQGGSSSNNISANAKWNTRSSSTPADSPPTASKTVDKNVHPSTPADSSTAPPAASKLVDKKVWQRLDNPQRKAIFPWRHETELLPRLMDDTQGGLVGPGIPSFPWLLRFFFTQLCAKYLNIPWYQAILGSGWKQELADASGWAFSQAVAGVIANTYRVPFKKIVPNESEPKIDFSTVTTEEVEGEKEADKGEGSEASNEDNDAPELDFMVDEKLRKLYEASHEFGRDRLRIVLQTEPISCELVSLLFIPYMTREAVKKDHSLRHTFRKVYRHCMGEHIEKGDLNIVEGSRAAFVQVIEFAKSRAQFEENVAFLESTVIAQVLVTCDELFSVTDVETGALVQGNGYKQRVPHLVRLEVKVKQIVPRGGGKTTFEAGSWQIVDWDDLLGGNLWFV